MKSNDVIKKFDKKNFVMTNKQTDDGTCTYYSKKDNISIRFHSINIDNFDNPFEGYKGYFFDKN